MPIPTDKLTFAALCVVEDAIEACRSEPIKVSLGLRFALSYLWHIGEGEPRHHFFHLIEALEGRPKSGIPWFTAAHGCMWAIKRHVGYPLTPEASSALSRQRT